MPRLLIVITLLSSCTIDRTIEFSNNEEIAVLRAFQSLPEESMLKIASDDEPGEHLLLCITFRKKEDGTSVFGQKVHFYHTSNQGNYEPSSPGDESTARLNGDAVSSSTGRIFVETILPGDYGSSTDNRHIHTTVTGARPEAYDIHFKQYSSFMSKNFIDDSDQHFLADLKRTEDGSLVAFLTMEIKNWPQN